MAYTDPLMDKARKDIAADHERQRRENEAERIENDIAHFEHERAFNASKLPPGQRTTNE